MKIIFLLAFLVFGQTALASANQPKTEALYMKGVLTLKVEKKEVVAEKLIMEAQKIAGYYASRNDSALHLKIPSKHVESYLAMAEKAGLVASRTFSSKSLSQELANVAARLKARRELLEKYFQILKNARSGAIVTVEKEVIRLISEIEKFEGRRKRLQHQADFSDVHISFSFRNRRAPSRNGSSPFGWINQLNLGDLIREFETGKQLHTSYKTRTTSPKGFAPYKATGKDFRAASHDNILYRVRRVKHRPTANIDFWAEAVIHRMKDAGYFPYGEQKKISSQKIANGGQLIKLSAPYGNQDFAYWIAFQLQGSKIEITEAAGELGTFAKHYAQNIEKHLTKEKN